MSFRYWEHGDNRFGYMVEAAFECPVAALLHFSPDDEPPAVVVQAAAVIGMDDAHRFAVMLRSNTLCGSRQRDAQERLTDRCAGHHCKMKRKGFLAFVDEPIPKSEWESTQRISHRLNTFMGGDYEPRRHIRETWCTTKKEAKQWAYRQLQKAKGSA